MPTLCFTSDWHVGITRFVKVEALLHEIAATRPDALIVAGDNGRTLADSRRALSLARALLDCPIGVLAGNHDLWDENGAPEASRLLFEHDWPALARDLNLVWLETDILRLGAVAVTGTIGWYDYSRKPPAGHPLLRDWEPAKIAALKGAYNNDAHCIRWGYTDPEFSDLVGEALERRLAALEADPFVDCVLVATHVPAFAEQQISRAGDSPIADAYFGNHTLGERISRHAKVSHVISGHTHREVRPHAIARGGRSLQIATLGSCYGSPKALTLLI